MRELYRGPIIDKENPLLAHRGEWLAVQYANHIVAEKNLPPAENIIKILHDKIVSQIWDGEFKDLHAGRYRYHDAKIRYSGAEIVPGRYVEGAMKVYGNKVDEKITNLRKGPRYIGDFLEFASYAHYHLAIIHPFADGNGRTIRQFVNLMCKRFDVKPFVIGPIHRRGYLDVLEKVNMTENLDHFTIFLASNLWSRYARGCTPSDFYHSLYINEKIIDLSYKIATAPKSKR